MASSAQLTQDLQPSTSKAPTSEPPTGALSSGPSTPAIVSVPGSASLSSYNMLPNCNTFAGGSQQPASSVNNSNPSVSPGSIHLPVSMGSAGPTFSYNISQTAIGVPANQQFQSSMNPSVAVAQGGYGSSASVNSQSVAPSANTVSSSTMVPVSSSNVIPVNSWAPTAPTFSVPPGLLGTPGTPGPPGLAPSAPMNASARVMDPNSSAVFRPNMLAPPASSNSAVQHQMYSGYPSLPPTGGSPQGLWLQPPQVGVMARPPYFPYPAGYPAPFFSVARGVSHPFSAPSDSHPPGVSSAGTAGPRSTSPTVSGNQAIGTSGTHREPPPSGIENREHAHELGTKESTDVNDQLDAWTAHKTETGIVYYYNAVTGVSTYERPSGFKGEPDNVPVQPTPVSMEHLAGTDWALVTTNDGKKYYYNSRTKVSSWQIPGEVAESKKNQNDSTAKEHVVATPNAIVVMDKVSDPMNISSPAVNTGGREALPFKISGLPGSSALDLIKKKLQDPATSATPLPASVSSVTEPSELNGSAAIDVTVKGSQNENNKDKLKDASGDGNMSDSSSDSEDGDSGPTKEECIVKFREMLKERGVAPFSKWEKELPKIVFDPRFKAIPSQSARRALFEHYVKTRAEEERKEKRAAQKAAIEGFKQLLEEASEDIDQNTDYQTFRKKWGHDLRFEALDRKDRELLLNERVLPLKRAAEEKAQAVRAATAFSFKSMLREKGDVTVNSRWSRVKDYLRDDPRYKSVKHEDREALFNEYISELKATAEEAEKEAKAKRDEQEKLKERERELRKRKEREEQEMERVRLKVRRKEAVASFQALLVETIKDPQASWTESKPKLEKDPQRRATNPDLDPSETEKLFREHVKMLYERCVHDFRALLSEVITAELAAAKETEGGKTVLNSWSTAKIVLKTDLRYNKTPRKEREALWRRHAEEILRKQKPAHDENEEKRKDARSSRNSADGGRLQSSSQRTYDRR